jgi:hypothetical protein
VKIDVERDDVQRLLTATATGVLTPTQIIHFIRTERVGPLRSYALLFDAREATLRARPRDMQILADRVIEAKAKSGMRGPTLIVATGRTLELMQLYETFCRAGGVDVIRVFSEMPDAIQALNEMMKRAR